MIWQDGLEYTKTILDTVDMLPLLRAVTVLRATPYLDAISF